MAGISQRMAVVTPKLEIFGGLSRTQIDEVTSWLERRDLPAGSVVVREGAAADGLFVLYQGKVVVDKGSSFGRFRISEISAPSYFGEVGLLTGGQRTAGIKVISDAIVGFLPLTVFEERIERNNVTALRISLNLARLLALRLNETNERLAKATAMIARQRTPSRF